MTAQAWNTLAPEVRRRIRMAVLDVVRTAPPGQFWTAYGLQRHADLEDLDPEHQTAALLELLDRGVVESTPSTGGWLARPWLVGDVVAVCGEVSSVTCRTATVERVIIAPYPLDGSCVVSGSSFLWHADGSCVGREGSYHLRRARS